MELVHKPDFEEARRRWRAFWEHEIIDRPCVAVTARRPEMEQRPAPAYLEEWDHDFEATARKYDAWAETQYFGGEAIPYFRPSFGPDAFAAFLGAPLRQSTKEGVRTSWAVACVDDWSEVDWQIDADNEWWRKALDLNRAAARVGEGRFLVGVLDLHSNADCLSAMRGPQQLCMDLLDQPEAIDAAMAGVRALYRPVYEALFESANMAPCGSIGWLPFYCEGRFATVQCDFLALCSPPMARRWIWPALEEEAQFLDHCILHFDGPDALPHLDDMLVIEAIDGVQWVPGAGNKPLIEWRELLTTIQAAGKSTHIYCTADQAKEAHSWLRPELSMYQVHVGSPQEADELLEWFRAHT